MKADGKLRCAGFEILTNVLTSVECDEFIRQLSALAATESKSAGLRNLLEKSPLISELASSGRILGFLHARLNKPAFPVRALFFDKTKVANWRVSWHQDLTIAVAERIETTDFETWSVKAGVPHVEAPREILESMLTLRLHLDDCTRQNGALHVIAGSHRLGKIKTEETERVAAEGQNFICEVQKGGALLMRPLLLHASWPAVVPMHRRVLHIEYATQDLPNGLCWYERRLTLQSCA